MDRIDEFCDKCKSKEQIIWFKTKDHYLDLKKGEVNYNQFEDFSKELEKHGLEVREVDYKTIEIKDPKKKIAVKIRRHECGPEILFDFSKDLLIAGIIVVIIEILKKLTKKKAKKRKEKPTFAVYIFQGKNRIQINSFDEKSILDAIQGAKKEYKGRNRRV